MASKAAVWFSNLCLSYLGCLSSLMLFASSYDIPVGIVPLLLVPLCMISAFLFPLRGKRIPVGLLYTLLFAVWAILRRESIADGFWIVVESISARYSAHFAVNAFITAELKSGLGAALCAERFMTLLALLLSLFLNWNRPGSLGILTTLTLFIVSISLTSEPSLLWVYLLIIYWLVSLLTAAVRSGDELLAAKLSLAVAPAAVLLLLLLTLISPKSGYERAAWPDELYFSIQNRLELTFGMAMPAVNESSLIGQGGSTGTSWRFNSDEIDLGTVGPQSYTGKTVLTVKTDTSGRHYLRGFSMSRYTGENWVNDSPLSYADIAPQTPDMSAVLSSTYSADYLRREEGRMGMNPMFLSSFSEEFAALENEASVMTIGYVNDASNLYYTPYFSNLMLMDGSVSDDSRIQLSDSPALNNEIHYIHAPEPDPSALTPSQLLRDTEELYRDYVYGTYLTVPDYLSERLVAIAGSAGINPEMSRADLAQAVADYISGCASYDLKTPVTPEGKDFVLYFLEESQRGYCMHFASAAVTMLQSLGVPARYVTGFAADIRASEINLEKRILDSSAHAWVEVYFDGIGWLPYEVTGSAQAGAQPSGQADGLSEPENPVQTTPTPETESGETDTPEAREHSKLWWLLLIPVALFILVAGLFIRSAVVLAIRERRFSAADRNRAAVYVWLYISRLGKYSGAPPEESEQIALKARFSQHRISEDELDVLLNHAHDLRSRLQDSSGPAKQIFYRYILCLY